MRRVCACRQYVEGMPTRRDEWCRRFALAAGAALLRCFDADYVAAAESRIFHYELAVAALYFFVFRPPLCAPEIRLPLKHFHACYFITFVSSYRVGAPDDIAAPRKTRNMLGASTP